MHCPNCGAEYREGFTRCSDCDVALVPGPPPAQDESAIATVPTFESIEPVCVHIAAARIDADIVVATLKAHEIRAFAAGTGLEYYSDAGALGQVTRFPGPLNSIMDHGSS